MLDAMPEIIRSCPSAMYVILGATHPNLVRDDGEAYRDSLTARVQELGIADHVAFFDQFVDQATLLDFISMCDVYVTPYLNEAQMTSGTLAYSFGLGKAVVSTPYWHAKELLGEGRGILVPFRDAKAMSTEIAGLLTNDLRRHAMRKRAYAASRPMTWAQTAKRYLASFELAREHAGPAMLLPTDRIVSRSNRHAVPEIRIGHFLSLCDSTGMLQHAVHSVPDRAHGYCVDDNARALLFSSALARSGETQLSETLTARFAAFIQHAWNPDTRRFRNFMSYDRRWLEEMGSEDSHGRTLWALAECASKDTDPSRRRWAAALFKTAAPVVEEFSSPRGLGLLVAGVGCLLHASGGDLSANRVRGLLADRCVQVRGKKDQGLAWFEDVLAYDNARLPQALIKKGADDPHATLNRGWPAIATLDHVRSRRSSGCFRPSGPRAPGHRQHPKPSISNRSEAATILPASLRRRADGDTEWPAGAMCAFDGF